MFLLLSQVTRRPGSFYPLLFLFAIFLLAQLAVAAPLRWYLARKGLHGLWFDVGLGALAGLAQGLFFMLVPGLIPSAAILMFVLVLLMFFGTITGLVYGLLRLRDRRAGLAPTPTDLAARFD